MTRVILDADVIIKLSLLDLFWEALLTVSPNQTDFGTLEGIRISCGLRREHVRQRKTGSIPAASRLLQNLQALPGLDQLTQLENNTAATIVDAAQKQRLPVDSGEATLMSLAIHRNLPFVTTGDLKAIASLQRLTATAPVLNILAGRIVCLEELICRTIVSHSFEFTHPRLLAGRSCDDWLDRTLQCNPSESEFLRCLDTRLDAMRRAAPGFLVASQIHEARRKLTAPDIAAPGPQKY